MAREEGIFAGVSSGASIATAIEIAELQDNVTVVAIVCDRGDRYLSTGVYS
jgi:cysteine synthase B